MSYRPLMSLAAHIGSERLDVVARLVWCGYAEHPQIKNSPLKHCCRDTPQRLLLLCGREILPTLGKPPEETDHALGVGHFRGFVQRNEKRVMTQSQ